MQKKQTLNYFIFGDSICVGQGVSLSKGWVTRIAQDIEEFNRRHECNVVLANSSRNGNTTRQALERMPYDVQSHGVDVLSVQFGLNDCNYWDSDNGLPRVSIKAFAANLEEVVNRGIVFGAKIIFVHTNHPTLRDNLRKQVHSYDENNKRYNQAIREAVKHYPVIHLIDIEKHFNLFSQKNGVELSELLLPDGLHLSSIGHDLYYHTIKDLVLDALENIVVHNERITAPI